MKDQRRMRPVGLRYGLRVDEVDGPVIVLWRKGLPGPSQVSFLLLELLDDVDRHVALVCKLDFGQYRKVLEFRETLT